MPRRSTILDHPQREAIDAELAALLDELQIAHLRTNPAMSLSGGERRRVEIARALASRPRFILLDEPFSNLDAGLRDRLRQEVREILGRAGVTALFVTHDQAEALSMTAAKCRSGVGVALMIGTRLRANMPGPRGCASHAPPSTISGKASTARWISDCRREPSRRTAAWA